MLSMYFMFYIFDDLFHFLLSMLSMYSQCSWFPWFHCFNGFLGFLIFRFRGVDTCVDERKRGHHLRHLPNIYRERGVGAEKEKGRGRARVKEIAKIDAEGIRPPCGQSQMDFESISLIARTKRLGEGSQIAYWHTNVQHPNATDE